MSYLVLARKYRPQTFADVIGQEHITQTLANAIAANRLSHAILLAGPRGTGKTTMARLLAKSMNCANGPTATPCNTCENCIAITKGNSPDVLEIDGASNNGVDQVRELRENSKYMPSQSRYKIYIIDEVHMLSTAAFNALLKTLEEPPAHVLFFFATTERHKLPVTILSRCQRYDFRRVTPQSVAAHLAKLCQSEGVEIDSACLDMIARESGGSVRDSISLLDQVVSTAKGRVDMAHAMLALGVTERQNVIDLAGALLKRDAAGALELVAAIYDSGYDLRKLHQDLLEYLRDLLLVKLGQNTNLVTGDLQALAQQAQTADYGVISFYLNALFKAESSVKYAGNSRLALETVLLRLMALPPAVSIDTLIGKLDDLCQKGAVLSPPAEKKTPCAETVTPAATKAARPLATTAPENVTPVTAVREDEAPPAQGYDGNAQNCLPAVVGYLEQNGFAFTATAVKAARLKSLNNDVAVIEVQNRAAISRLKSEKYTAALKQAFKAALGREVRLEYECAPQDTKAGAAAIEARRAKEQALVAHPLINDALDIFKGSVVGISELKQD